LNEKKFRNGEKEIDVPMKALISASNELPAKDQGLEALWDRFLVRLVVEGIEDIEKFNEMVAMPSTLFDEKIDGNITDNEYKEWSKKIDQIVIPDNVFNVIQVIRNKIKLHNQNEENIEKHIYVSDRRWRKIVRLMRTSAFLNDRAEVDLMDCFLIKHCIWSEEEQKDTVWQFVSEAVEERGYTKEIDFTSIRDELVKFKTEIDDETKFIKNTRKTVLLEKDGYYELTNPPSQYDCYIQKEVFKQLTNEKQYIYMYYTQYSSYNQHGRFQARKGKDKFHVLINDTDYQLKTIVHGDKRQQTKKPNPKLEEIWDNQVSEFLQHTSDMRNQIEQYRNKDLEHLRKNLFVEPALANIIESHITATQKEIEKLELEIRGIQNGYKKLKDEEIVTQ
jgi:MoxR-like ATPase